MAKKIDVPFNGTKEQEERLKKALAELKVEHGGQGLMIAALQRAQDIYGYLPEAVQQMIADELGVSLAEVYAVATFYAQFSLYPKGQYKIGVCLGTACYVKGSDKILQEVEKELGIKVGECTEDGLFSIDSCRCVGACGLAPVMMINEDVHGRLTPEMVKGILDGYRRQEV